MKLRSALFSAVLLSASLLVSLGVIELVLRVKNSSMRSYDVEMWRYSRELKVPSADPVLAFDHVKNSSALLQSVTIRTNEWGLRGGAVPPRKPDTRRILFLGGSITLGWGVQEEDTISEGVRRMFAEHGRRVEVLNGGIGNYNAERYVERFFTELAGLEPTDIVVQYFLRDAEHLDPGGGNFFLRHSELAFTIWLAANRLAGKVGEKSIEEHYRSAYQVDQPGYQAMLAALDKLAAYGKAHNVRLYFAMTPDIHNLANYPFAYIHERMLKIAAADGYAVADLLPAFGALRPEQVWAMPGDPHPNGLGHQLMADAVYRLLSQAPSAAAGLSN